MGGKRAGKRGRGAEGKTAILVACEHNDGKPGFVAMKAVPSINKESVRDFAKETIGTRANPEYRCFLRIKSAYGRASSWSVRAICTGVLG